MEHIKPFYTGMTKDGAITCLRNKLYIMQLNNGNSFENYDLFKVSTQVAIDIVTKYIPYEENCDKTEKLKNGNGGNGAYNMKEEIENLKKEIKEIKRMKLLELEAQIEAKKNWGEHTEEYWKKFNN